MSSVGEKPGKYTQMALNNMESSGKEAPQHVILRPVSGKSNSNRYSHIDAAQESNRSRSNDRRPAAAMYYEDEEELE